jgi:hypothetical protein
MQLGFPNVCAVFIDQRDERALTSAIATSELGREFQTASATTHDDNFVLFVHFYARDQVKQLDWDIKRHLTPLLKNSLDRRV